MRRILDWAKAHRILSTLLLVPPFFVMLGPLLVFLLPDEVVAAAVLEAVLLSSPRWSMVVWVLCGLWLAGVHRRLKEGLGLFVFSALLMGWPFASKGEGLFVISANVQAYSDSAEELENALSEEAADVVLTIEQRGERIRGMHRVGDNYGEGLKKPSHGMAFFCREGLRCQAWISPLIGAEDCSMPVGFLRIEEAICLIGIHVPPPVPICATGRRPYVDWVVQRIQDGRIAADVGPCRQGDAVLAAGDFNATQGSWTTRAFLKEGLWDPQYHRGVYASTWPAGGGWPNFPVFRLDHAFAGALSITGIQQFRLPKADHKALRIWVDSEELNLVR